MFVCGLIRLLLTLNDDILRAFSDIKRCSIYILLTEFEGRTVSYEPSFLPPSRLGHKSKGKKRGSVTYTTHRENEVSKIFIISLPCV